jgi:hypothetical protein
LSGLAPSRLRNDENIDADQCRRSHFRP